MEVNIDKQTILPNTDNTTNVVLNILKDTKVSFVVLLCIIISIYIGMFFLLDDKSSTESNISKNMFIIFLEIVLWILLIVIIFINIRNFDTNNVNFQTKLSNLFDTKMAELDIRANSNEDLQFNTNKDASINEVSTNNGETCESNDDSGKEVFHISNNVHTYNEAKELCEKYDSRLASYDEIERAYTQGANWCSYGWSKDQLALFPTQQAIYNELKEIPDHEHDCGRPGINGGYIANPNVKFGVNCYGIRPKPTEKDKKYMHALNHTPSLSIKNKQNKNQQLMNKNIVAPFNRNSWSQNDIQD